MPVKRDIFYLNIVATIHCEIEGTIWCEIVNSNVHNMWDIVHDCPWKQSDLGLSFMIASRRMEAL